MDPPGQAAAVPGISPVAVRPGRLVTLCSVCWSVSHRLPMWSCASMALFTGRTPWMRHWDRPLPFMLLLRTRSLKKASCITRLGLPTWGRSTGRPALWCSGGSWDCVHRGILTGLECEVLREGSAVGKPCCLVRTALSGGAWTPLGEFRMERHQKSHPNRQPLLILADWHHNIRLTFIQEQEWAFSTPLTPSNLPPAHPRGC